MIADVARMRQIGNSDGLTFRAEGLRHAHISRGDEVRVDYEPDRIVISRPGSVEAECRELYEELVHRYGRTLDALAK